MVGAKVKSSVLFMAHRVPELPDNGMTISKSAKKDREVPAFV